MDGEAGWWTTSGNIGLPPLARVTGVGRQQQQQCGAYVGAVEEMVCVGVAEGHSDAGCDLASTLCKYDLRKGDLFVPSWARVRRVKRGSLSSELLMCGGGVRSILLLPLVASCL